MQDDETEADPLLVDVEGHAECLLGNEAIVRGALEAGVGFASGYPGTPSSEVTDSFARVAAARGVCFEYSVNEKVALEMAFAASLAGARSICAMKHLGLLVAGDPLSTIPYVGTVGGMVIVSAGDPSCRTSPNEHDQRHLGPMLHVPVLDPAGPRDAYEMARGAFELSERSHLPVLLRITTRVAHTRGVIRYGRLAAPRVAGFVRDPARFVPIPANARRMRLEIPGRLAAARAWMAAAGLFRRQGSGRRAIVAAGAPAATCADLLAEHGLTGRVVLATLGGLHPLPQDELCALLSEVDEVLVLEELSPFVEAALLALCAERGLRARVLGKRSGHLPEEFEYTPEVIQRGLHAAFDLLPAPPVPVTAAESPALPARPPVLCAGCPHRATYFAARAAFGADQLYFNDIGCYTLGYDPPLETADALLCMGAGFTLAAGVSRVTGARTVGFLGDSTFFHAGMPALLDAIQSDVNMVAVVLDNQVTAMTGFQASPMVDSSDGRPRRRVSIAGVARALGARQVETIDPADLPAAIAAFERARDARGLSVIVAEHPCPVYEERLTARGQPGRAAVAYQIDAERCRSCGREGCGMRCDLGPSEGHQRHMARSRALERGGAERGCERAPVAPCAERCPLGLCVQGYAGHIAAGQYERALELIMSRCPLPDSVCRVCHRPCEPVCVRGELDEPVAINDLKRFVMDWAAAHPAASYDPPREEPNGRAVAVVGAGPAGLAAAHELALRGYAVTLFDANDEPGGLLLTGIPGFRLPRAALRRDVARILALGATFRGGVQLGRELELSELLGDGFDAVFLAVGAQRALELALEDLDAGGAESEAGAQRGAPRVVDALAYLAAGDRAPRAERVVVVGGGNAALDAARSARRRGARSVVVAYRRGRDEMPALADEVAAAAPEGIELCTHLAAVALRRGDQAGLVCQRTEPGAPDASGRRAPRPVPGSETLIPADLVIAAVGQVPALDFTAPNGRQLEPDRAGGLRVDPETGRTSHPRVFAGGDLVPGARTVTDAIAAGQRAAWGIDRALRGASAADRRPPPPRPADWPGAGAFRHAVPRREVRTPRARPTELDAAGRTSGFDEVVASLSEAQARTEAARCAVCGQCGNCRACIDLFGCPAFFEEEGRIGIDALLCNSCGVCADFCPNQAIRPAGEVER